MKRLLNGRRFLFILVTNPSQMKIKPAVGYALSALIFIVYVRLFCGVYTHDEYGEERFFIKHKPVWKWHFHSPRGQSDLKYSEMSDEQKSEQDYFNEFISGQNMSR